eukprot:7968194-Lingulodinium_polyedra.AAC.1
MHAHPHIAHAESNQHSNRTANSSQASDSIQAAVKQYSSSIQAAFKQHPSSIPTAVAVAHLTRVRVLCARHS